MVADLPPPTAIYAPAPVAPTTTATPLFSAATQPQTAVQVPRGGRVPKPAREIIGYVRIWRTVRNHYFVGREPYLLPIYRNGIAQAAR